MLLFIIIFRRVYLSLILYFNKNIENILNYIIIMQNYKL